MNETTKSAAAQRQAEYRQGVARRLDEIQVEIKRLHEAIAALGERQQQQPEQRQ